MSKRKVNKQSVRSTQSRRRREETRKEKEQFRNRIIAGAAFILLLAVVGFFALQLRGTGSEVNDNTVGEVSPVPVTPEGTLLEGDRPLVAIEPADRNNYYDAYPDMVIDTDKSYQAVIHTVKGDMLLQLYDDESPLAVNNFVFLATQGFYDNVVFHRVLQGFMAQGGDPLGTGTGGPGYGFANEVDNGLSFDKPHLLAMAHSSLPDSNGSQFFITFVETPQLNGGYTVFGELLQGEDVLNSITFIDPDNPADDNRVGDTIESIDIYES
ncbi:MAG: peptidylprolyl isomerase [Candidatus Promineifilaceae bacterium]